MHPKQKLLGQIFFALLQVRQAIDAIDAGPVHFYPDFNLLHPVLFRQNRERYRYTDTYGSCLFALNDLVEKHPNLHICLSLPTVMEFLFALHNKFNYFDKHLNDTEFSSYVFTCMNQLRTGAIGFGDINSERVKEYIRSDRNLSSLDQRIATIQNAIITRRVGLLTDYYTPKDINQLLVTHKSAMDSIKETMQNDRWTFDDRSDLARSVSYKADAHNTFLCFLNEISSTPEINFVCSERFYRWAGSARILQVHQKTPLMLIILLGNYGSLDGSLSWEQKHKQIRALVDRSVIEGRELLNYCDKYSTFSLDMDRKIVSYTMSNLDIFLQMARSKHPLALSHSAMPPELSYETYLEILEGRKNGIANTIRTVHELIDDNTDDMYRDFVSDERIKLALSTLKLG